MNMDHNNDHFFHGAWLFSRCLIIFTVLDYFHRAWLFSRCLIIFIVLDYFHGAWLYILHTEHRHGISSTLIIRNRPDVYARVAHYVDWIEKYIYKNWPHSCLPTIFTRSTPWSFDEIHFEHIRINVMSLTCELFFNLLYKSSLRCIIMFQHWQKFPQNVNWGFEFQLFSERGFQMGSNNLLDY